MLVKYSYNTTRDATLEDLELELWLRQRERKQLLWKTKDGKSIPIDEMTDKHLINAITRLYIISEKIDNIDFEHE